MTPLAIDLFCGLGGWTQGLLAEGYGVVGFDIEAHDYGDGKRYPAQLVIQDVLTIHGRQFKHAALIVASPPCQEYSWMAMPWSRAKQVAKALRGQGDFPAGYKGSRTIPKLNALFDACFRIQREAIEAAGHFIPLIVENVRGAQPWVGKARWNFGSYYLWGDVPALMPITMPRRKSKVGSWDTTRANYNPDKTWETKNTGGSWFNIGSPGQKEVNRNPVHELAATGFKTAGMNWSDRSLRGQDFTRIAGQQAEGVKVASEQGRRTDVGNGARFTSRDCGIESNSEGVKGFTPNGEPMGKNVLGRKHGSKSKARKAASARIAKIPLPLARWIAKVYYPR